MAGICFLQVPISERPVIFCFTFNSMVVLPPGIITPVPTFSIVVLGSGGLMSGFNAPASLSYEILTAEGFEVTPRKGSRPVLVLIALLKSCYINSMTHISLVQNGHK